MNLRQRFRAGLDEPAIAETFFGAGLVEGRWRVGYYLADRLIAGLGALLSELAALSVEDAHRAAFDALRVW